jgi:hypothetical protein
MLTIGTGCVPLFCRRGTGPTPNCNSQPQRITEPWASFRCFHLTPGGQQTYRVGENLPLGTGAGVVCPGPQRAHSISIAAC